MKENTVVAFQNPSDFQKDPLTEVLQAGARELLAQAVEAEVSVFLGSHAALVDAAGRRRVVRNGYLPERFIQTGIGPVSVRQPRVRDRGDGANLLPDVAHHYIHRNHTKLALIHRDHRAVAAQVFTTATAFDKSDNTSGAVSQSQMRVARDLG